MTFLLGVDGQLIDVDALWNHLIGILAPESPVGRPTVTLAIMVGLRLATEHQTLAKALLATLERQLGASCTPEQAEVTIRELTDAIIERAVEP